MALNQVDTNFLKALIKRHEESIKEAGRVISEGEDEYVKQIAINVADRSMSEKRFAESILRDNRKEMKENALLYCKSMANMDSWKKFYQIK